MKFQPEVAFPWKDAVGIGGQLARNAGHVADLHVGQAVARQQRQIIELAYFGGYTHAEIAERWNIPLGTVKGRMRLGLAKMRITLGDPVEALQ